MDYGTERSGGGSLVYADLYKVGILSPFDKLWWLKADPWKKVQVVSQVPMSNTLF